LKKHRDFHIQKLVKQLRAVREKKEVVKEEKALKGILKRERKYAADIEAAKQLGWPTSLYLSLFLSHTRSFD
jgi:hypothetical protein